LTDARPTLVLADDSLTVTEAACTLLRSAYNIVRVALDGEQAVQAICELKPEFAVLDIAMPKISGIRVAQHLHRAGVNTLIVFVTIIDDDDYIEEARLCGHGYVLKRRLSFDLLAALASARDGIFFCSRPSHNSESQRFIAAV
jgi:DNA-binding NarL/FixJ family response regulator